MAAQTTNEQALAKANEVMAKKGFTVEMIMQGIAAYFTHKAKLDAELYKAYLDSKQTQANFEQTHGLHKQTIKDMRKYYHLTNRKTSKSQQSESRAQEAKRLMACDCGGCRLVTVQLGLRRA